MTASATETSELRQISCGLIATGVKISMTATAVFLITYHIATVWVSFHGAMQHYITHLTGILIFASLWVFQRGNVSYSPASVIDMLCGATGALLSLIVGLYLYTNAETLEIMQPFVELPAMIAGGLLIFTVLIVAWRMWGAPIALICVLAAAFMIFGHLLPEPLTHRKQPFNVAISFLGGLGGPRGVLSYAPLSADMIFLLLIYGGLLHGTRVIDMFGELGAAIGNVLRGGVAYSAIVASTLIGMVTGQAVSNIALSGVMTIPTMKKNGFTANEAGAIEVMASTGSQLLPPIMGLGAFLMAVILGVSYIDIVIAGFIPGILYMIGITFALNSLIGSKLDIDVERTDINWSKIRWILPSFALSFGVLITLLVMRYSPSMAGFWGGLVIVVLSVARPATHRPKFLELIGGFKTGLITAVQLAVVLAAIGIVVQTLTTTGLGVSAGRLISQLSGDSLFIALSIGMAVSLIVGMGLPTPAAYALIAIIVVPSLIEAGLPALAANMYGFYFAIFSALTPPVAVGILVASRISGGDFLGTAWQAAKLGCVAILVPFVFVSIPSVLTPSELTFRAGLGLAVFGCCAILIVGAVYGALSIPLSNAQRVMFSLIGPITLVSYLVTHFILIGLVPIVTLMIFLILKRKNNISITSASEV